MELVSPILDVGTRLWTCIVGQASYITDAEETFNSLTTNIQELKALSNDVKSKVQVAEQQGMNPSEQVQVWLTRVQETENKANQILQEYEQLNSNTSTCLQKCQCRSTYKIGKRAIKTLDVVTGLIRSRGGFQEVAIQMPRGTEGLYEMPMENPVGTEYFFQCVWEKLNDDMLGKIGLFGMGGVGKTTLLKRINNELSARKDHGFHVAFWIVASKQTSVEAIQRVILEKLQIPTKELKDKTTQESSALIYENLKEKRYILMLDDVWDRLDLSDVGLPTPNDQNKSKIIFTTRSEDVCYQMEACLKIKVTCLPWEMAWALFQEKVGGATLSSHNEIPRLAKLVAKECDGLPLALITIGRAMASRRTPSEWSHALQLLRKYPSKFSGMGEHVLPVLKFSYDNLPDSTIKECFVYCSLFPEDFAISTYKLVDLWIAEGFLNEFDDISEARNHGFYIIQSLKLTCLLESGNKYSSTVKMHDVIRDMALWIASNYGKHNKRFMIFNSTELKGTRTSTKGWNEEVEKIVCMKKDPPFNCLCPQLSTLLVYTNVRPHVRPISMRFFQFITSVRILDFSESQLSQLPEEISLLSSLEYLDVSWTALETLPIELRNLGRLKHLQLNYMEKLENFPTEIIIGLTNLQVFRMNYGAHYDEGFIRALEGLEQINEVSIHVYYNDHLVLFLQSPKLQSCTRYLRLNYIDSGNMIELSSIKLNNLEALQIYGSKFNKITFLKAFNNLQHVIICHCDSLKELDYLVYAPSLENLWVSRCHNLLRIIHVAQKYRGAGYVFSSLKRIRIEDLPCLEYICNKPLHFPSLENVYVQECFKLRELPFSDTLATGKSNLESIEGERQWWESLRWTHVNLKQHFSKYFRHWIYDLFSVSYTMISIACWPENKPDYTRSIIIPNSDDPAGLNYNTVYSSFKVLRASMNVWRE